MNYEPEQWRAVVGYDGYYEVSDHGSVRGLDRRITDSRGRVLHIQARILSMPVHPKLGYCQVRLHKADKGRTACVNVLVLEAFRGPRPAPGMHCCHGDGNPTNNHISNLRWGTCAENHADWRRHKRERLNNEFHCKRTHPLKAPNLRRTYADPTHLRCLACHRARGYIQHRGLDRADADLMKLVSDTYYRQISESASLNVPKYLDSLLADLGDRVREDKRSKSPFGALGLGGM
jgi:HNH endonuclease/NUMOD4 motif